jgi:hypothetical protein
MISGTYNMYDKFTQQFDNAEDIGFNIAIGVIDYKTFQPIPDMERFAHFEITQVTQNFGDNAELFEELGIISGDARYTTKLGIH